MTKLEKFTAAFNQAIELMNMCDELEPTSAFKQCASDNNIHYGAEMSEFINWAFEQ